MLFMLSRKPCRTLLAEGLKVVAYPSGMIYVNMHSHPDSHLYSIFDSRYSRATVSKGMRASYDIGAKPTVLLALAGPNGNAWRLLVGAGDGSPTLLSLPNMVLVENLQPHDCKVTSLAAHRRSGGTVLLSGDCDGIVCVHGEQIPGGRVKLFTVAGVVDALRCETAYIHVHIGWERKILHWDGTVKGKSDATKQQRIIANA